MQKRKNAEMQKPKNASDNYSLVSFDLLIVYK
jgi:hypothetical protein